MSVLRNVYPDAAAAGAHRDQFVARAVQTRLEHPKLDHQAEALVHSARVADGLVSHDLVRLGYQLPGETFWDRLAPTCAGGWRDRPQPDEPSPVHLPVYPGA